MKKRGQVIPTAATFVLLFLLFMLGFILLLPPEERTGLLGGEFGEDEEGNLLSESPGFVGPRGGITRTNLFDIHLFNEIDTEISHLLGNLVINKNLFFGKSKNVSFNLKDIGKLEGVNLFYAISESKGNLIISLNGDEIYNAFGNQNFMELNLDYLKEGKNILNFDCSGLVCKYDLKNLKIVKKYIVDNRKVERVFSLNKKNVKSASLSFYLDCIGDVRGNLKISLNGNGLLSDRFICNNFEINDIPLSYLEDENRVVFEIDEGDIVLENVFIESETGGSRLLYFFDLSDSEFSDVRDGINEIVLEMLFDDYGLDDWLRVYVNNELYDIRVRDFEFIVISDDVKKGKNSIALRALDDFEIVDLTVRLE